MTAVASTVVRRLLAGATEDRPVGLSEHRTLHGAPPRRRRGDADRLQLALAGAGLRGRGGAGFPSARKLAVARASGRRGTVIANGSEGEPASLKDQVLLVQVPHLVLDGAQLAARAIEAREVVLAVHAGTLQEAVLLTALAERRTEDVVPVRLLRVPDRYVAGEASALASAARGGASQPVLHDRPLAVQGLDGRPTAVLNVETLAGLALFLLHGASRYAELGTSAEPGTVLLTLRSSATTARVVEVALGTPLGWPLRSAGLAEAQAQAVLVGGYFGAWLPSAVAYRADVSHGGLRAVGGTLGAGVVAVLGSGECGLRATADAVGYLAGQSAGQCGPCLNGLPAIAGALHELAAGRGAPATLERLHRWCGLVAGRGLCHHPDGTVALVRSALTVFAADVVEHLRGGCGRPAGRALAVPGAG